VSRPVRPPEEPPARSPGPGARRVLGMEAPEAGISGGGPDITKT
jgi:hypothetical protein